MFCPKCGKETSNDQKFCRSCGLKFGEIVQIISEANEENIESSKLFNKSLFEKLGHIFLYAFLGVGFAYLFYLSVYYKFLYLGKEMMWMFGVFGFFFLGFLSIFFLNFFKIFGKKNNDRFVFENVETNELAENENLLSESSFEPIPSVTEDSTELLPVENKTKKL